jgi:dTDP-4-dehydrorhamnose 3,5-epimerase
MKKTENDKKEVTKMEFVTPKLFTSKVFHDERGFFFPQSTVGYVQSNLSYNPKKWTFRGMHYQKSNFAQTKLVTVVTGKIIDFAVDIRPNSPSFGYTESYQLSEGDMLLVPKGYAHGFFTLEDNTLVQYLVDEIYMPQAEGSIHWLSIPDVCEPVLEELDFERFKMTINKKDDESVEFTEFIKTVTKK